MKFLTKFSITSQQHFTGSVLKEVIGSKLGALVEADRFQLGDPPLSIYELWCSECQEGNTVTVHPERKAVLEIIAKRERCDVSFIGQTNNSKMVS